MQKKTLPVENPSPNLENSCLLLGEKKGKKTGNTKKKERNKTPAVIYLKPKNGIIVIHVIQTEEDSK